MIRLEGVVQFDDEWVTNGFQNPALRHGALGVLGMHNDRRLFEHLHCIQGMRAVVANQIDFAIAKQKKKSKEVGLMKAHSSCMLHVFDDVWMILLPPLQQTITKSGYTPLLPGPHFFVCC